jgi:hypothetical protein
MQISVSALYVYHKPAALWRPEGASDPLEVELKAVVSCLTWAETKPRSSARVANTLKDPVGPSLQPLSPWFDVVFTDAGTYLESRNNWLSTNYNFTYFYFKYMKACLHTCFYSMHVPGCQKKAMEQELHLVMSWHVGAGNPGPLQEQPELLASIYPFSLPLATKLNSLV